MPYPKAKKQEDPSGENRAVMSAAPGVERVVAPQVTSASGGAPKLNKNSLSYRWRGTANPTPPNRALPVPSHMNLQQAEQELGQFSQRIKANLDAKVANLPAEKLQRSRFWRMYQQYPGPAATLIARRMWTDQMVGTGNVADWMGFIEGKR